MLGSVWKRLTLTETPYLGVSGNAMPGYGSLIPLNRCSMQCWKRSMETLYCKPALPRQALRCFRYSRDVSADTQGTGLRDSPGRMPNDPFRVAVANRHSRRRRFVLGDL